MRVSHRFGFFVVTGVLLASIGTVDARLAGVRDGFENGNAGGWVSSGDVRPVTPDASAKGVMARSGKTFVVLTNPLPFPGASLTNLITVNAAKGSPCSLDLWVQAPGKSGALTINILENGPTGTRLASRTISAPTPTRGKRTKGYAAYQLNFAHSGTPFFVSLDAIGPVEVAIDDFSLSCRAR